MKYAIILAGGIGSRFWPLSRQLEPKQFLSLCSEKSMLEETIHRISPIVKEKNIYIAANKIHKQKIKRCIGSFDIPLRNFFFEPEAKNTLAPIAVLSKIIYTLDRDAVIAVLPSDHFIKGRKEFLKLLTKGIKIAQNGHIVTLGILPARPETGYGYIKISGKRQKTKLYYKVEKFVEKPNLSKAKKFVKDGIYYWNSGIFIFRADIILKEIKEFLPKAYQVIMKIENKNDFINFWHKLPATSIDYAVMERTDKAVVLPIDCGWIDLGSWQAITELIQKNKDGNIFKGNCLDIESKNTFVYSDNRLVATLGLKDIIVIDTLGALLVCAKDKTQDVKKIVQLLKINKFKKHL